MQVSGLYAGIGGFELGFERAGHRTILLCENDVHASRVLRSKLPNVLLHPNVETLPELPTETEVVTAGFPCQNLSMAGDKTGIAGGKSSVIDRLFQLLDQRPVPWVVIENVYFMLHLRRGAAIAWILDRLEERHYRWAYRVVDSRAFGLPQRRRRVFIVASPFQDPRNVLLADDTPGQAWPVPVMTHPIGFYWTEGRSGNGLTGDAIPPLKAGSALGIPSPPAVLLPNGGRVVTPTIEAVERLQGFPNGWTSSLRDGTERRFRWRLVGNAVSVPVAEWIGRRLSEPGVYDDSDDVPLVPGASWPSAAWNMGDGGMSSKVSECPLQRRRGRISAFATEKWPDLSERALSGFVKRARDSKLRYPLGFLDALEDKLRRRP
ncbi:MAG: DNA (cytosine-5-)-methyltransferase [Chromatiales bacterium]|nr:DNA (cytosine-5-)-methyltransferase [Chromatiales bacterium]